MVQTRQFYHDYLGSPDMNMAAIAKGFGVDGEVVEIPAQLREALSRARQHTVERKPYLLDVQVARKVWRGPTSRGSRRSRSRRCARRRCERSDEAPTVVIVREADYRVIANNVVSTGCPCLRGA